MSIGCVQRLLIDVGDSRCFTRGIDQSPKPIVEHWPTAPLSRGHDNISLPKLDQAPADRDEFGVTCQLTCPLDQSHNPFPSSVESFDCQTEILTRITAPALRLPRHHEHGFQPSGLAMRYMPQHRRVRESNFLHRRSRSDSELVNVPHFVHMPTGLGIGVSMWENIPNAVPTFASTWPSPPRTPSRERALVDTSRV